MNKLNMGYIAVKFHPLNLFHFHKYFLLLPIKIVKIEDLTNQLHASFKLPEFKVWIQNDLPELTPYCEAYDCKGAQASLLEVSYLSLRTLWNPFTLIKAHHSTLILCIKSIECMTPFLAVLSHSEHESNCVKCKSILFNEKSKTCMYVIFFHS